MGFLTFIVVGVVLNLLFFGITSFLFKQNRQKFMIPMIMTVLMLLISIYAGGFSAIALIFVTIGMMIVSVILLFYYSRTPN